MKSFIPSSRTFFKKLSRRTIQCLIVIALIPTLLTGAIQRHWTTRPTTRKTNSFVKSRATQKIPAMKSKTSAKVPRLDKLPKLSGASAASFGGEDVIDTTIAPTGVTVADFNGDGKPD